jgi:hypothetical protein
MYGGDDRLSSSEDATKFMGREHISYEIVSYDLLA